MIKNYVEMVTDDIDKVIRTGEYDYIIKNCKTEKELRDRLYDVLLTDVRVTGNATRDSSYYLIDALKEMWTTYEKIQKTIKELKNNNENSTN